MTTHEKANELIAAFALDAVPPDEHEHIEAHLKECPRCRDELDALRGVAAALANSVEAVPGGLWSKISNQIPLDEDPVPTMRTLRQPRVAGEAAEERSLWSRPLRSTRGRKATVATSFTAAAAITTVLVLNMVHPSQDRDARELRAFRIGTVRCSSGRSRLPDEVCAAGTLLPSDIPTLGGDRRSDDLARDLGTGSPPGDVHPERLTAPVAAGDKCRTGRRLYSTQRSDAGIGPGLNELSRGSAAASA
jgi:hypothetical protein